MVIHKYMDPIPIATKDGQSMRDEGINSNLRQPELKHIRLVPAD